MPRKLQHGCARVVHRAMNREDRRELLNHVSARRSQS